MLPLPLYTVPLASLLAMNFLSSVSCSPDKFVLKRDKLWKKKKQQQQQGNIDQLEAIP